MKLNYFTFCTFMECYNSICFGDATWHRAFSDIVELDKISSNTKIYLSNFTNTVTESACTLNASNGGICIRVNLRNSLALGDFNCQSPLLLLRFIYVFLCPHLLVILISAGCVCDCGQETKICWFSCANISQQFFAAKSTVKLPAEYCDFAASWLSAAMCIISRM